MSDEEPRRCEGNVCPHIHDDLHETRGPPECPARGRSGRRAVLLLRARPDERRAETIRTEDILLCGAELVDLTHALALADEMDDQERLRKMKLAEQDRPKKVLAEQKMMAGARRRNQASGDREGYGLNRIL